MNRPKPSRKRRSAYARRLRARNRRFVQVLAGLACLLIWLAYGELPQLASGRWIEAEAQVSMLPTPVDPPSVAAAVSAQRTLLAPLREAADPPPAVIFNVLSGDTEPATDSAPVAESTLPEESTHVPFLQSAMAAVDPSAAHFGHGPGFGAFGGGGFGGGTGGAAQAQTDSTLESQFGDTGSERASLLGDHAQDEAFIGDDTNGGSNNGGSNNGGSNNGGSNNGGSNNGGSNSGGSNNGGSNNGGSNNGGSNNGGSNNGGLNNGGLNNGGSNNGGSNTGGSNTGGSNTGGSPDETAAGGNSGQQQNGEQAASFVTALDVPEPGLMLLTGVGIAAAFVRRRARRA